MCHVHEQNRIIRWDRAINWHNLRDPTTVSIGISMEGPRTTWYPR
jgi:hypothetical protein